mmetsp:Transcript_3046/g.6845  ORF Transcript_3046/g.6845 Transcript_3046/m.6845 type:complete len:332 (-) Transcript_3046:3363-4358(-)
MPTGSLASPRSTPMLSPGPTTRPLSRASFTNQFCLCLSFLSFLSFFSFLALFASFDASADCDLPVLAYMSGSLTPSPLFSFRCFPSFLSFFCLPPRESRSEASLLAPVRTLMSSPLPLLSFLSFFSFFFFFFVPALSESDPLKLSPSPLFFFFFSPFAFLPVLLRTLGNTPPPASASNSPNSCACSCALFLSFLSLFDALLAAVLPSRSESESAPRLLLSLLLLLLFFPVLAPLRLVPVPPKESPDILDSTLTSSSLNPSRPFFVFPSLLLFLFFLLFFFERRALLESLEELPCMLLSSSASASSTPPPKAVTRWKEVSGAACARPLQLPQ